MFHRPEDHDEPAAETRFPIPGSDRKPVVTWTLLGFILALWLLAETTGGSTNADTLLTLGAMEGQRVAAGDYWRLFAAMFLHSGLVHLGLNCFGLFIFGQQTEQMYGHVRFAAIYLLAGLGGSVASYALNLSLIENGIGVGASGAIFGVIGALVAFFLSNRDRLGRMGRQSLIGLLALAAINLAFGLAVDGVDNYAHVGGFVSGLLLGLALSPDYRPIRDVFGRVERIIDVNSMVKRSWVLPLAVTALTAGVLLGNSNVGESPIERLRHAEDYLAAGEVAQAFGELERAIEIAPNFAPAYLMRARMLADMGNISMAVSDVGKAVRLARTESEQREAVELLIRIRGGRR